MDDVQSPGPWPPQRPPAAPPQPQWRWVAHPPFGAPGAPRHPAEGEWRRRRNAAAAEYRRRTDPSPRYRYPPAWGLPRGGDYGGGETVDPAERRDAIGREESATARQLRRLSRVLVWVGAIAAVIGWIRYGMVWALGGAVVHYSVEWISAGAVYLAFAATFVVATAVTIMLARWLVAARAAAFWPGRDPRRRAEMWALTLVPLVNALYLPVLLREIDARRRVTATVRSRARWAWLLFGVGQLVGLAYWSQTLQGMLRGSAQAQANALTLGALLAALAAGAAWFAGAALRGAAGDRATRRFVYVGPAGPVDLAGRSDAASSDEPVATAEVTSDTTVSG